jgi:hypothetical protein
MDGFISVMGMFVVRLVLPITITVVFVLVLRWLDGRWQAEANSQPDLSAGKPHNSGCWDVHKCSDEQKAHCTAYAHPETPCWQVKRNQQGILQEQCLGCKVFQNAIPIPLDR